MPCRFYNFEFGRKFLLLFVNLKILEWELEWGPKRLNWKQKIFIMFIFYWWRGTEGEDLGVEAAGVGVFLKISSLFVKIHRWVLVRMSLNCKLSSLNGGLPNCSKLKKAKEPLHGPNSVKKCRRKLLFFFCLLVSIVLK